MQAKPVSVCEPVKNIVYFDLETQKSAEEVGGWNHIRDMRMSVGVTFSTAVGGLDAVIAADRLIVKDGKTPNPFTNPNSCINMVGGKVSILTGATGPITATITACAPTCFAVANKKR